MKFKVFIISIIILIIIITTLHSYSITIINTISILYHRYNNLLLTLFSSQGLIVDPVVN